MPPLKAINTIKKTGQETFSESNKVLDFKLLDFWSWSQSSLMDNTLRGILAEYIVKQALEIESGTRTEWDSYDLETHNGIKIEVKSAAYLQSWKQSEFSKISFGIAPTKSWDEKKHEYLPEIKRQADYYVFCLLHYKEKRTVNPLKLEQWSFYVLPTSVLNEHKKEQKQITLNSLLKLNPTKCGFNYIKEAIKQQTQTG